MSGAVSLRVGISENGQRAHKVIVQIRTVLSTIGQTGRARIVDAPPALAVSS